MSDLWKSRAAVAMIIALFALVSHGLAEASSPNLAKTRDTLRFALLTDPHSLDPARIFSNEEGSLGFLMFQTLIDSTPDGGLVPVLAESLPETSDNHLFHTFHLRRGVRFSDGRELTAEDVTYTFERLFEPATASPSASAFLSLAGSHDFGEARTKEAADPLGAAHQNGVRWIKPVDLEGVRALDRYTVQFHLDQPDLSFLKQSTTLQAAIVSRRAAEKEDPRSVCGRSAQVRSCSRIGCVAPGCGLFGIPSTLGLTHRDRVRSKCS